MGPCSDCAVIAYPRNRPLQSRSTKAGRKGMGNERLVDIVKKAERGELKQDPRHITELRLN